MKEFSPNVLTALEELRPLLSKVEFSKLQEFLAEDLPTAVRINLLKHNPQQLIQALETRNGWRFAPVAFCPSGYELQGAAPNLSKSIEHALGDFYIQESASMLPVELFDLEGIENPVILDMAASPGGKTTHLVDKTLDKGLIIANDASRGRIPALRVVLEKWGAINQAITCQHGDFFGTQYPETFDAVLLDAPCSMQNLHDSSSHPMRSVNEGEQQSLSNRQYLLLRSALQTVRVGGQVIYSTCTLSPQEDELVVQRILDDHPELLQIDDLTSSLPIPAPGLTKFAGQKLSPQMKNAVRLWPHLYGTSGFFSVRFTKLDCFPADNKEISRSPRPNMDRRAILPLNKQAEITDEVEELYNFPFSAIIDDQNLALLEKKGLLYLIPRSFLEIFPNLPITSIGIPALKPTPQGYQISHALASRFGGLFQTGIIQLDDVQERQYLSHQDIFHNFEMGIPRGATVLVKGPSGRILGRAKLLKDRLKNLLPTRLF